MKRHPRYSHLMLFWLIFSLFMMAWIDALLFRVDPFGLAAYQHDWHALQTHAIPAPDGRRYEPGVYDLRVYDVTINAQGFRAVPESRGGACVIAFMGDSTTFAMGSNRSFVNFLTPELPAVVVNAGMPGYNVGNIARLLNVLPADGYVWLTFPNDSGEDTQTDRAAGMAPPALYLYLRFKLVRVPPEPVREDYYREQAAKIIGREDVLTFAFEGQPLSETAVSLGAVTIPMFTETVSVYDGHGNEASNAGIANSMRSEVVAFVQRRCELKNRPAPQ